MSARVLFFGATADIVGKREIEICVDRATTTEIALKDILRRFPGMASHKLHISINQHYANGDEIIRDGDELAIFTAVSGG
jgi:molybdopterin converting factor small subunit